MRTAKISDGCLCRPFFICIRKYLIFIKWCMMRYPWFLISFFFSKKWDEERGGRVRFLSHPLLSPKHQQEHVVIALRVVALVVKGRFGALASPSQASPSTSHSVKSSARRRFWTRLFPSLSQISFDFFLLQNPAIQKTTTWLCLSLFLEISHFVKAFEIFNWHNRRAQCVSEFYTHPHSVASCDFF